MYQGTPRVSVDFSAETVDQKQGAQFIQGDKRKKPTTKDTLPSKDIIQNERKDKEFNRQANAERMHHH